MKTKLKEIFIFSQLDEATLNMIEEFTYEVNSIKTILSFMKEMNLNIYIY